MKKTPEENNTERDRDWLPRLVRAREFASEFKEWFIDFIEHRFDNLIFAAIFGAIGWCICSIRHIDDDLAEILQNFEFVGEGHVVLCGFVNESGNLRLGDNPIDHRVAVGMDAPSSHDLGNELLEVFVGQGSDPGPLHGEQSNIRVIQIPDLGDVSVDNRIEAGTSASPPISELGDSEPQEGASNHPAGFLPVFIHIFSTSKVYHPRLGREVGLQGVCPDIGSTSTSYCLAGVDITALLLSSCGEFGVQIGRHLSRHIISRDKPTVW